MPMPITPELAAFMRSLGYDQLRQAYKEKYGKPYPMFCLSETKKMCIRDRLCAAQHTGKCGKVETGVKTC